MFLSLPPASAIAGPLERWGRFCLRRRVVVVVIIALLSAGASRSLSRATLQTDFVALFLNDGAPSAAWRRYVADFGDDTTLVAAWEEADPLGDEALARQRAVALELARLPAISAALSLPDVPRWIEGDALGVEPWGQALARMPRAAREELWPTLLALPEVGGVVLAPDRRTVAVLATVPAAPLRDASVTLTLLDDVRAAAARAGVPPPGVHLVGLPITAATVATATLEQLRTLLPATVIVLLAMVLLLFGRLGPVVVSGVIGSVAALWALGITALVDPELTVMHTVAPPLIFIVALAETLFLQHAYARARIDKDAGHDAHTAAGAALREVGPACLLTTLTTQAGFFCLCLVPGAETRVLGVIAGLGVGFALLLAVTLGPVLLVMTSGARARPTLRVVTAIVNASERFTARHARVTVAVAAVLIGLGLFRLPALEVETDWSRRYPAEHPMVRAQAFVAERFGAVSSIELVVRPVAPAQALDAALLTRVRALETDLRALPGVRRVHGLPDVLMRLQRALAPAAAEPQGADDDGHPAALLGLLDLFGLKDVASSFMSERRDALRVSVVIGASGLRDIAAFSREVEAIGVRHLDGAAALDVTGLWVMIGRTVDDLLFDQMLGVALMVVVTTLLCAWGFGTLRTALVALVPNLLPLLVFVAALTLPGRHFDSDHITLVLVGLGLAVDDTIHFLTAHRQALARGLVGDEAVSAAYASAGAAMVHTSLLLVVGLLPLAWADDLSLAMFSRDLAVLMIGALLGDLLVLPSLLRLGFAHPDGGRPAVGEAVV